MWELLYKALLGESQKMAPANFIARHLARVALYELKGFDALYSDMQPLAQQLLAEAQKEGMNIYITETFRPASVQKTYYDRGRRSPGSIVTNAQPLQSYHQYGLAFDIAFSGNLSYPNDSNVWKKVGEIGEKMSLIWGGRFGDNPHFEYHPGYTWQELKNYLSL